MLPVFVINLTRSVNRRKSIESQLKKAGLNYNFIEAYDAVEDDTAYRHALNENRGINLSRGHIGCVMSHVKTWGRIQGKEEKFALIMEDDVILSRDLGKIIESAVHLLDEDNIYHVSMQVQGPILFQSAESLASGFELCKCLNIDGARGTQAYIISKKLAALLARELYPVASNIDMWSIYQKKGYFKDLFVFFPFPVIHGEFLSDLNEEKLTSNKSLKDNLKLLVYKYKIWPLYTFFLAVRRARVERRQLKYILHNGQPVTKSFKI